MTKETFKNIWAVIAGMLTGIILALATDTILEKLGIFPDPAKGMFITWMLLLATIYRSLYITLGGYITSKLAVSNPYQKVKILAFLALAGNLVGLISTWNMNLGPHWYPIAITILAYPSAILGYKLIKK